MVRKQVENLRGLVFTMEEMCEIIIPIIETSLCMLRLNGNVHERNTLPVYIEKPVELEEAKDYYKKKEE